MLTRPVSDVVISNKPCCGSFTSPDPGAIVITVIAINIATIVVIIINVCRRTDGRSARPGVDHDLGIGRKHTRTRCARSQYDAKNRWKKIPRRANINTRVRCELWSVQFTQSNSRHIIVCFRNLNIYSIFVAIIYKLSPVAFSETIISNHDVERLVHDDRRGAGRTLLPEGTGECRMSGARDNRSIYKWLIYYSPWFRKSYILDWHLCVCVVFILRYSSR